MSEPRRARSLAAYLVLPRPDEARAKAPMAVLAYGLVHVGDVTGTRVAPATALVAWAVFELAVYQARYMLNDLIDADVDRLHVAADSRSRLPAGAAARRGAIAVLAGRLLLAAVVVALLPSPAQGIMLAAAGGVALATLAYEAARAPMRRGPGAGAGGAGFGRGGWTLPAAAVLLLVGAGYAVRVGLGVALAGAEGVVVAAAVALGWFFGTLGVVMAWTLEAAGLRSGGDTVVMARKAHIASIARLVDDDPTHLEHPLLRGAGARITATWFALSAAAAVALGLALGESPGTVRVALLIVVGVGVAPVLLATWPHPAAGAVAVASTLVAAAVLPVPTGRDEMVLLFAVVASTAAVARTFTPESIDLNPSAGTPAAPPADPAAASPGATTARPAPARGRDGAGARSPRGSEPAARP